MITSSLQHRLSVPTRSKAPWLWPLRKLLVISVLVSLMLVPPWVEAAQFKIATLSPDSSSWMRLMREGATEIKQRTQGRVQFKFYPGGVMGDDQTVLRKIRIRQLQGGALISSSLIHAYPDNQIYGLPMQFRSLAEVDYVRQKMDQRVMDGIAEGGFITFGLAGGGFAYIMSQQPVRKLADLESHKLWVLANDSMAMESVKALGLNPIPLKLADVLIGLQTGLIDTVTTSPVAAIALQWHTQIRYLTELPISYFYALLVIDHVAFERLDSADQQIVRQVMTQVFERIDRQNRVDNVAALEALRGQGITFLKPSPAELAGWQQAAAAATARLLSSKRLSAEAFATLHRHLKDYRSLHEQ